ncbi:MAG: bifunctional methionine sulfoxide reductase B/A protein [Phocaeicola sp.]
MVRFIGILFTVLSIVASASAQKKESMKQLTPEEKYVMEQKGTEAPFTGKYYDFYESGTYSCKKCGAPLYRSTDKFDSGCGWPSFDDEIKGAVKRTLDADGKRIEITCAKCGAHLGHVFEGEQFTPKNIRHCVNSISLEFTPAPEKQTAIFAGGCFWGVEHLMQQQAGVISVESGYIGGKTANPTYEEVCSHNTGHAEAVRIVYNPAKVDYETLAKLFFEIHDPTQLNRQGPDVGDQYRSEVFYENSAQKEIAQKLIEQLHGKGYDVKTKLTKATTFYPAETYHQDYYVRKGTQPYCHMWVKRF